MEINEKKELAASICKDFKIDYKDFKISRLEDVNADLFIPDFDLEKNIGIIIDDEGRYIISDNNSGLAICIAKLKAIQKSEADPNKENERFIKEIKNKDGFIFNWISGSVSTNDTKKEILLKEIFNNKKSSISLDMPSIMITDDTFVKIKNYVVNNINRLIKIALEQNSDIYEGTYDYINLKYKSVYVQIDFSNIISTDDKDFYNKFITDIIDIIEKEKVDFNKKTQSLIADIDKKIAELDSQN